MHKGRETTALVVVLMLLCVAVPYISVDTDADVTGAIDGVRFYEIGYDLKDSLGESFDGLSLMNYGSDVVNLSSFRVTDESGKVFVLPDYRLDPKSSVTFLSEPVEDDHWFVDGRNVFTGRTLDGGLLNNGGDNVYLYDGQHLVDTVSYESPNKVATEGWSGEPARGAKQDQAIKRCEPTDTDTAFDWVALFEGSTSNGFFDVPTFDNCTVEPFVFPDSKGRPVFDAIMSAKSSICVSIYFISSVYMVSLLTEKAKTVDVRVLVDSEPLGQENDVSELINIDDEAKGEVRFIGGDNARYAHFHNKYAIVDSDTVVITSENWTHSNLGTEGNRGWGAVVHDSPDYAQYMMSYFENDWYGKDTISLDEKASGPVVAADMMPIKEVETYITSLKYQGTTVEDVSLRMYMSSDNASKALHHYIGGATERVYSEQMDLGSNYRDLTQPSPLLDMKKAADRGVDARFLISPDSEFTPELVDMLNTKTNVKAGEVRISPTMHNKGVIIDDCVWVSSVNWTQNALENNRECGLYIMNSTVTNFYVSEFMEDWDLEDRGDDLTLRPVMPDTPGGEVTFSVRSTDGSTSEKYEWKVVRETGTETYNTDTPSFVLFDSKGLNYVLVTSSDGDTGRFIFKGAVEYPDDTVDNTGKYITIGMGSFFVLSMLVLLIRIFRK